MIKLKFKNNIELEVLESSLQDSIDIEVDSYDKISELRQHFTSENLSEYSFYTEGGILKSTYTDKIFRGTETSENETDGTIIVSIKLKEIDQVTKLVESLRQQIIETQTATETLTNAVAQLLGITNTETINEPIDETN